MSNVIKKTKKVDDKDYQLFHKAYKSNNKELAQNVLEKVKNSDTRAQLIHHNYEEAFKYCCDHGYGDIIKLLLLYETDPLLRMNMLHSGNYACFRYACERGYIDIMKLLLQEADTPYKMV